MPHLHDKIDFVSDVYVVHNNKVLLRKHDKYGIWLSVGGHIELNEDPNQAAIREVKEEVGLNVTLWDIRLYKEATPNEQELIPPVFLNRHFVSETHEHVSHVYFALATTSKVTNEGEEASDEVRWFSLEDLEGGNYQIIDRVRAYAKLALEKLAT